MPRVSLGQLVHLAQVLEPEVEGPPVPRELLDLAVQRALLVRLAQRELQAVLDCQVARERRDRVERQDCLELLVQAVASVQVEVLDQLAAEGGLETRVWLVPLDPVEPPGLLVLLEQSELQD